MLALRIAAGVALVLALSARAQPGDPELTALVGDLGHEDYAARHRASLELLRRGRAALAPLREAAGSADPEIAWRARGLLEVLAPPPAGPLAGLSLLYVKVLAGQTIRFLGPAGAQRPTALEVGGHRYAVGSLRELAALHSDVWDKLRRRAFRGVEARPPQPEWPAIGVRVDVSDRAVAVLGVLPTSPAEQLGLRPGDQLIRLAGRRITRPDDIRHALQPIAVQQTYVAVVLRPIAGRLSRLDLLGVRASDEPPQPASRDERRRREPR